MAGEEEELLTDYDGDLAFYCDLGSWIEWNVYFKGYYSPDLSLVIKKLVKPGMTAIDVGANVGSYTLLMAKRVGREGRVIAFEPNQEVATRLRKNIAANTMEQRVKVLDVALGDYSGLAQFHTPQESHNHRGISSLTPYVDVLTEKREVRIDTLDNLLPLLEIHQVDFVKIDAEGSDPRVIRGGQRVISRHRPIVIFEANHLALERPEESILSVQNFLFDIGYSFFNVAAFGRLSAVDNTRPLPDSDIVCLPRA